jgi:hypothetical protein
MNEDINHLGLQLTLHALVKLLSLLLPLLPRLLQRLSLLHT